LAIAITAEGYPQWLEGERKWEMGVNEFLGRPEKA
jgi:hypothetical protein